MSKLPSVLSVQRGTIVTDGEMSSLILSSDGSESLEPVRVIRHGIRGTLPKKDKDSVANPQRTESAKTSPDASGLHVQYTIRTIDAKNLITSCSDSQYQAELRAFIDNYFRAGVQEYEEVCRRYARNILNGRWLWRNRVLGDVVVKATVRGQVFSSEGSRMRDFEDYTQDEKALASILSDGLGGANIPVQVEGRVMFGFRGEVEVFPSQNMITSKPKGFARSLYKIKMISRRELSSILSSARKDGEDAGEFCADMIDMGRAAIRDQKIGNAVRTIDTWYEKCDGTPIPIEPNGASLEQNVLYREDNYSAEKLLTKIHEMKPSASEEFDANAAFLIALLIRGGVFSGKKDAS
jgi:CRISPR-associated protein Csy3